MANIASPHSTFYCYPPNPKKWVPELREGATFGQNLFSDFGQAWYSSIESTSLLSIFHKKRFVNRSNVYSTSNVISDLDDRWAIEVDFVEVFQHWNVARLHFLVALVALEG